MSRWRTVALSVGVSSLFLLIMVFVWNIALTTLAGYMECSAPDPLPVAIGGPGDTRCDGFETIGRFGEPAPTGAAGLLGKVFGALAHGRQMRYEYGDSVVIDSIWNRVQGRRPSAWPTATATPSAPPP